MKIALCGFLGSGCTEIAEILAAKFGLEPVNTSRIIASVKNFDSLSRSGEIFFDKIIKQKLDEMLEKEDGVIVEGRSAFFLLDRKDVVKIFLNASFEDRVKHVAERRGISIEEAREDVERSDEDRRDLLRRFLKKDTVEAGLFDFAINTSSKTYSKIADILYEVIKSISES